MTPCKSCGFIEGRLTSRRAEYYRQVLGALDEWQRDSARPSTGAIDHARGYVLLLLADDQGLCVLCADKVVLP